MIHQSSMTVEQKELTEMMGKISDDCFAVGWYDGLEKVLWNAVQTGETNFGNVNLPIEPLVKIAELAEKLKGWVMWIDNANDPMLSTHMWGAYFVPFKSWVQYLKTGKTPAIVTTPVQEK